MDDARRRFDDFYVAFQDRFRGSPEDVKQRLKVYLTPLAQVRALDPNACVIDLGCGRGEWLQLLRECGYSARGIENNPVMLARCRAAGLDVLNADALQGLSASADRSAFAITAFHVVEHMPFAAVLKSLDECMRVLLPGGMAIFETPNPQNVAVGSCNFYLDPSHVHPLPSATLRFAFEYCGMCDVRVLYLHPVVERTWARRFASKADRRLTEYFDGAQDYAVVGYKPLVDAHR